MSVVVVGLNHRRVPLELLEAVAVGEDDLAKAIHDLSGRPGLDEVAVVSTCMRTEVYASAPRYHAAVAEIRTFLADWSGLGLDGFADHLYDYFGDVAVHHLFTVAAGLDSALLGEGEILRQVRDAGEAARAEGAIGPVLGPVFRHAVEVGKRVRSETAIARGTTSLSHTAVSLACAVGVPLSAMPPEASGCPVVGHHPPTPAGVSSAAPLPLPSRAATPTVASDAPDAAGHAAVASRAFDGGEVPADGGEATGEPCAWADLLAGRRVLVVGAGEMGQAVASLVASAPEATVTVTNRSPARAEALAARIAATAVPWSGLAEAAAGADLIFTATSSPAAVLDAGTLGDRRARPVVVVDLAVPRDVAPDVAALPGVTLFDISELKRHAEAAMAARRAEVPAAERIVEEELARHGRRVAERDVVPTVAALHARGEDIRRAELARLEGRLGALDDRQRAALDTLTHGIVAKLLHDPTMALKAAAGDEHGARLAGAVDELFGLASPPPPTSPPPSRAT